MSLHSLITKTGVQRTAYFVFSPFVIILCIKPELTNFKWLLPLTFVFFSLAVTFLLSVISLSDFKTPLRNVIATLISLYFCIFPFTYFLSVHYIAFFKLETILIFLTLCICTIVLGLTISSEHAPSFQGYISISSIRVSLYIISGMLLAADVLDVPAFHDFGIINSFACFISFDTAITIYFDKIKKLGSS